MTRRVLFQIHWFLGISAGLLLALMGVTGAMMSFEDEIVAALSPGVVTLTPRPAPRLAPVPLAAAAAAASGAPVTTLVIERDPTRAPYANFAKGVKGSYLDPYDGHLLGGATGEDFFKGAETLHRRLVLRGKNAFGEQLTGIAALSLLFFALSGLYLRWPKRPLDWRSWFVLDTSKRGRNLYRALHATIGTWLIAFYLLSSLTGLWWSYDWYKQTVRYVLTGEAKAPKQPKGGPDYGGPAALAAAWGAFEKATPPAWDRLTITLPKEGGPIRFLLLPQGARYAKMTDDWRFDQGTGALQSVDRYVDRPLGVVIVTSVLPIHDGSFFGTTGRVAMMFSSAMMPLFTVTGLLLYLGRRRRKKALAAIPAPAEGDAGAILIAYAGQTGNAERLARLTAAAFDSARVRPLATLDAAELANAERALFVVSTYGEGEAPDMARAFARRTMAAPAQLATLDYAVLALGDREYPDFCAFGRRLDQWLCNSGASRMFDVVEMDGEDEAAKQRWQQQLLPLGACSVPSRWARTDYDAWTLVSRELLNPGSLGGAAFRIRLAPQAVDAAWWPGDIAELLPRHDPERVERFLAATGQQPTDSRRAALLDSILPTIGTVACADDTPLRPLPYREYSIASIASSGAIELIVRQCRAEDGGYGIGSGYLTHVAAVGDTVRLRVRRNLGFAPQEDDAVPLILIGNGTGLAGLLAHARHRAKTGGASVWLIYGERQSAVDRLCEDTIGDLQRRGTLVRVDRAFSRDPECARYVQQCVASEAVELRRWVDEGAALYVCGSLAGMAPAVDAVLRDILGEGTMEVLIAEGRYRRDVY